jgi:hypothetical protein
MNPGLPGAADCRRAAAVRPAWLVAGAALLLAQQGLLWWLYWHGGGKHLVGDEVHYLKLAQAILAGGAWQQDVLWPPAQGVFLAALLALGHSILTVQVAQTLLFLGCAALLWHLWLRLSGSPVAAAAAAALFVLNPSSAAYAHWLWPEIGHLFVLLAAFDLLLARTPGRAAAFAAGVAVGLALLFKSLLIGFWPLFLLCFVSWKPWRVRWAAALAFVVALGLTVAPALMSGHRQTGHWRIADSSAINLLIGLGDSARNDYIPGPSSAYFARYRASGETPDQRDAWAWRKIDARVATDGLPALVVAQLQRQYYRLFESKTLLLTQLPGPRCAGYLGSYAPVPAWIAGLLRWSSHLAQALTLAGFAFGLFLARGWRAPGRWLLLAFVGYQLALYLGLHVQSRYLLPMMPVFCGFAGDALARSLPGGGAAPPRRTALAAGAVLAALLLWLAFAGPWIDHVCSGAALAAPG